MIFAICFILNLFAISDDSFYNAYSIAYSNTLLDYPLKSNPVSYGNIRHLTTTLSYANVNFQPYGKENSSLRVFSLYLPDVKYGKNFTYHFSYESSYPDNEKIKILNIGGASYHLLDFEKDYLDVGVNFKKAEIYESGKKINKNFYDIGFLARKNDYLFGLSFLNFNSTYDSRGSLKVFKVKKVSITRLWNDFSLGFDFALRDTKYNYSNTLSLAFSKLIRTYRYGYFRLTGGLTTGNKNNSFSTGIFYNRDVYELGLGGSIGLDKPSYFNNSISFTIYWGRRDVESDYERIIKREVKYRKDLMEELINATKREDKLRKEIAKMQAEIDDLVYKIKLLEDNLKTKDVEKNRIEEEKERIKKSLDAIVERQKRNEEELKNIEEKRKLEQKKLTETEFNREFENYLRLKSNNASKDVLINYLKKLILSYQDKDIDISRATIELQKLLK